MYLLKRFMWFSFVLCVFVATSPAYSTQPPNKWVYLNDGSKIKCNKVWVSGNRDKMDNLRVWYSMGKGVIAYPYYDVDIEKTFGVEIARAQNKKIAEKRKTEGLLARFQETIAQGINPNSISSYTFGDVDITNFAVRKVQRTGRSERVDIHVTVNVKNNGPPGYIYGKYRGLDSDGYIIYKSEWNTRERLWEGQSNRVEERGYSVTSKVARKIVEWDLYRVFKSTADKK